MLIKAPIRPALSGNALLCSEIKEEENKVLTDGHAEHFIVPLIQWSELQELIYRPPAWNSSSKEFFSWRGQCIRGESVTASVWLLDWNKWSASQGLLCLACVLLSCDLLIQRHCQENTEHVSIFMLFSKAGCRQKSIWCFIDRDNMFSQAQPDEDECKEHRGKGGRDSM